MIKSLPRQLMYSRMTIMYLAKLPIKESLDQLWYDCSTRDKALLMIGYSIMYLADTIRDVHADPTSSGTTFST